MARATTFVSSFYYKAADDYFIKDDNKPYTGPRALTTYKFSHPSIYKKPQTYVKNALPLAFRGGAETLLIQVVKIVNTWKLPSVYTWQIEEVCRWLRGFGYPQYQHTFRVNLVNGRTLLLLDASALSAINIKNFDHIRHIAYGIRCLFHYEMAKFGRSISLPEENYFELYKLLRVKNGTKYDNDIATSLWRRMQLIRQPDGLREHWEMLNRWLSFISDTKRERIGVEDHRLLFKCNKTKEKPVPVAPGKPCKCMPPCECYWTNREKRTPWMLSMIAPKPLPPTDETPSVLTVLYKKYPERYGNRHVRKGSI